MCHEVEREFSSKEPGLVQQGLDEETVAHLPGNRFIESRVGTGSVVDAPFDTEAITPESAERPAVSLQVYPPWSLYHQGQQRNGGVEGETFPVLCGLIAG